MPGRRRTSRRRRAPRPHIYRGQQDRPQPNPFVVPERRSRNWNQWAERWELHEYSAEKAREHHLVSIEQIAAVVRRTRGTVRNALDSINAPKPAGLLIREGTTPVVLFDGREVTRWFRQTRPNWLSAIENTQEEESTMADYGPLTRSDLTAFDTNATKMILDAIEVGVTGKVSRKTHCILRNAAGQTMSIQRKLAMQNRSAQNTRAEYKRFMEAHAVAMEKQGHPVALPAEAEPDGTWFCDLCQTAYPEAIKEDHMAQTHPNYTFCTYVLEDGSVCGALVKKHGMGPHIRMAHKVTKEERSEFSRKGAAKRSETMRKKREGASEKAQEPAEAPVSEPVEQITDEQIAEILERPDEPQVELPEPTSADFAGVQGVKESDITDQVADAVEVVRKIRSLLGKDPRVAELEEQVVVLTQERDDALKAYQDLEAKVALASEALGLNLKG